MAPRVAALISCLLFFALMAPAPAPAQTRSRMRINGAGDGSVSSNSQEGLGCANLGNRWLIVWPEQNGVNAGRHDIYGALSDDDGLSFGPMFRIDLGDGPNAADSDAPRCVICDDGTMVVIWEEARDAFQSFSTNDDLFFNRSTDGGATWLPTSMPLNINTAGFNVFTDIDQAWISSSGNTVHVTWEEDSIAGIGLSEELWYVRSDDAGATWTAPILMNTLISGHGNPLWAHQDVDDPKVASDGNLVVVGWIDDRNPVNGTNQDDVVLRVSQDGGQTFGLETFVEGGSFAGDANNLQLTVRGNIIVATWEDTDPNEAANQAIHGAYSLDAGATWSAEVTVSPQAAAQTGVTAFRHTSAICDGPTIAVVFVEDSLAIAGGQTGGQAGSKAYVSVLDVATGTWTFDTPLDAASARRNNRTHIEGAGDHFVITCETNTNGSNRVAFTWSGDRGVSWGALTEVWDSGPDTDMEGQNDGPFFAFNPTTKVGVVPFYDRPLNHNEVYASAVKVPFIEVQGAQGVQGNIIHLPFNAQVTFGVSGYGISKTLSSSFYIVLSTSGYSQSVSVGGGLQVHIDQDFLTLFALTDLTLLAALNGPFASDGAGQAIIGVPWPYSPGAPDLYACGIVFGPTGIEDVTDPVILRSF